MKQKLTAIFGSIVLAAVLCSCGENGSTGYLSSDAGPGDVIKNDFDVRKNMTGEKLREYLIRVETDRINNIPTKVLDEKAADMVEDLKDIEIEILDETITGSLAEVKVRRTKNGKSSIDTYTMEKNETTGQWRRKSKEFMGIKAENFKFGF